MNDAQEKKREKCLLHEDRLGSLVNSMLTILEEDILINGLQPCARCLGAYDQTEVVRIHVSLKTVYDALRIIRGQIKRVSRVSAAQPAE